MISNYLLRIFVILIILAMPLFYMYLLHHAISTSHDELKTYVMYSAEFLGLFVLSEATKHLFKLHQKSITILWMSLLQAFGYGIVYLLCFALTALLAGDWAGKLTTFIPITISGTFFALYFTVSSIESAIAAGTVESKQNASA